MGTTAPRTRSDRIRAWWSLALLPPAFVVAFIVGEGLITLYGYEIDAAESPPRWAILGAGVPALLVFAVPAMVTTHFARRGLAAGDQGARAPMLVAIGITAIFVLQNLAAFLLG